MREDSETYRTLIEHPYLYINDNAEFVHALDLQILRVLTKDAMQN
jgi:hypothetical protein